MHEDQRRQSTAQRGDLLRALVLSSLVLVLAVSAYLLLSDRRTSPVTDPHGTVDSPAVTTLTPDQFSEMLTHEGVFVVNTHIPYEGEIRETDAFIPFDETTARLADYPTDRATPILVYCESGRMSALAAADLLTAGYQHVFDLEGGMQAWETVGYERIVR